MNVILLNRRQRTSRVFKAVVKIKKDPSLANILISIFVEGRNWGTGATTGVELPVSVASLVGLVRSIWVPAAP